MSQFNNPFTSMIQNGSAVTGTLTFYDNGTTNLKDIYSDQALTTVATNPMPLDSHGRPESAIFTSGLYTVVLKDAAGVTLATQDGVGSTSTGSGVNADTLDGKTPSAANVGDTVVIRDEDGVSAFDTIEVEKGQASSVDTADDVMMRDDANNELIPVSFDVFKSAVAGLKAGEVTGCYVTSNSVDPTHDIDISAGGARDASNTYDLDTSGLTKRLDAVWAAGDGNGGTPAAILPLSADTSYRVFLIGKVVSGAIVVDAGVDSSATATNLLAASGYTYYAEVGSVVTDTSSGTLREKLNVKGVNYFATQFNVNQDTNPGTSAVTVPTTLPADCEAILCFKMDGVVATDIYGFITGFDLNIPGTIDESNCHVHIRGSSNTGSAIVTVPVDSSGQAKYQVNTSVAALEVDVSVIGYRDR